MNGVHTGAMKRQTEQNSTDESKRRRQTQAQAQAQLEAFEEDAQEIAALLRAQAGQNGGSGANVDTSSGECVQLGGDNVTAVTVGGRNHSNEELPPPVHHGANGNGNVEAIIPPAPPGNVVLPQSQNAADSDDDMDNRIWLAPSQRRVPRVGNEFQVSLPKI